MSTETWERADEQCFVYPALLHLKITTTRWQRILDIALCAFGAAACIFTSSNTCV